MMGDNTICPQCFMPTLARSVEKRMVLCPACGYTAMWVIAPVNGALHLEPEWPEDKKEKV